jgi:uncharacterized protein (TIGR02145 family)
MGRIVIIACFFFSLSVLWTACEKLEEKVCTNSFTDERDGQEYCIFTIGAQTWMAENLRYSTDSSVQNPLNPTTVNAEYGRLYSFNQANMACPNGWHLPTDDEWKVLEMELGMTLIAADAINDRGTNEGNKLKSLEGWNETTDSSAIATDSIGFNALASGEHNPSFGPYFNLGTNATFWTATVYDTSGGAWNRDLRHDFGGIARSYVSQRIGYSCRCVQD